MSASPDSSNRLPAGDGVRDSAHVAAFEHAFRDLAYWTDDVRVRQVRCIDGKLVVDYHRSGWRNPQRLYRSLPVSDEIGVWARLVVWELIEPPGEPTRNEDGHDAWGEVPPLP